MGHAEPIDSHSSPGNIVLYVRSCSVLGVVKEEVVREVFEANHTQEGCVQMTLYTSKLCMHASTYTHAHTCAQVAGGKTYTYFNNDQSNS